MMRCEPRHRRWFIFLTFFLSLALDILPLPGWVIWLRPAWTLLVLIYWLLALPNFIGLFAAFILGLLLDLLNGAILGEHAAAFVIIAFFVIKFHRQIRVYPLFQQTGVILFLVFIYLFTIFSIQAWLGQTPYSFLYWFSALVTTFLWPWVFVVLRDWRRRLNVL